MTNKYMVTFSTTRGALDRKISDLSTSFGGSRKVASEVSTGGNRSTKYFITNYVVRFPTKTTATQFVAALGRRARVWRIADREITRQ